MLVFTRVGSVPGHFIGVVAATVAVGRLGLTLIGCIFPLGFGGKTKFLACKVVETLQKVWMSLQLMRLRTEFFPKGFLV